MYTFKDKGDRDICLIPEVTAIIQELYKKEWRARPKPIKLFYVSRCYRYDRPQLGRYREFTQFGVELLGGKAPSDEDEVKALSKGCLDVLGISDYTFNNTVKRGLRYYVEDGFEIELSSLGAQKQVVGGGRYDCGIGFAIGVDRIMIAKNKID